VEHWLHLWLECGATTPSPLAKQALRDWAENGGTRDWSASRALAEALLDPTAESAAKADALLDLMSWYQATRQVYQARRLSES
jgi:hypothetical protein